MRLADFIQSNMEAILGEWEEFARNLAPGSAMSVIALRDHAESILRVTARDMLAPQTAKQQSDKSKGHGGGGEESEHLDSASQEHAIARLGEGFNLIEVVSEYRALRASVLRLWQAAVREADARDLEDLTRFNESIDQSLAEAVRSYTSRVDESRELFLATLGHDLRAPLNAMMLSAEVLARSGQLDGENAEIASRMSNFGRVMTGMIHDLLDFTRTRLGAGMPLSVAPSDLLGLCRRSSPSSGPPIPTAGCTSSPPATPVGCGMPRDSVRFCRIWSEMRSSTAMKAAESRSRQEPKTRQSSSR